VEQSVIKLYGNIKFNTARIVFVCPHVAQSYTFLEISPSSIKFHPILAGFFGYCWSSVVLVYTDTMLSILTKNRAGGPLASYYSNMRPLKLVINQW